MYVKDALPLNDAVVLPANCSIVVIMCFTKKRIPHLQVLSVHLFVHHLMVFYILKVLKLLKTALQKIKVFVKHYVYAPCSNKVQKAIFSLKVKVKVTRSLTLMSFEGCH